MYNYSTDQIYLLYEKCKKLEMRGNQTNAIILYNSLAATSPSHKQEHANMKSRSWGRFMDSLDWNKIREGNKKPSVSALTKLFSSVGIPVKEIKKVM